jgi:hypothetical protein
VDPFFHPFAKDGMVYLISNNVTHAGVDICVDQFQELMDHSLKQKNSARTCNDGLRLACILLDEQHRGSVAGIMTKKNDRKKCDIPGDPTTHFFEKILLEAFMNIDYCVSPPLESYFDEFPEDEKAGWDPNHHSIFEQDRDGAWLRSTWDNYVRPKYKKSLDKWNKDTGGGDGSPVSFIDFCGADRWLVWVFCKDLECNFLLGNNAGGRMPRHLQLESGFQDHNSSLSSIGEETGGSSQSAKRKVDQLENDLAIFKDRRLKLDKAIDKVTSYLDNKGKNDDPNSKQQCINRITEYSQKMTNETVLDSMSPDSKNIYVSTLKQERKKLLLQMQKDKDDSDSE